MKRPAAIAWALAALVFAALLIFVAKHRPMPPAAPPRPPVAKARDIAVLGIEWGATSAEAAKALGHPPAPSAPDPVFHPLVDPAVFEKTAIYEVPNVDFGPRKALLRLVFTGDRLTAYYYFLEGGDEEALDRDVMGELAKRFGAKYLEPDSPPTLKAIWSLQTLDVNYWLAPNEFKIHPDVRAAVGIKKKGLE